MCELHADTAVFISHSTEGETLPEGGGTPLTGRHSTDEESLHR